MVIIAKLEQIPIAALPPSVRPVDVLGCAVTPDAVVFNSEPSEVSAAADDELEIVVIVADRLLDETV